MRLVLTSKANIILLKLNRIVQYVKKLLYFLVFLGVNMEFAIQTAEK